MAQNIKLSDPKVYLGIIAVVMLYAVAFLVGNPFWGDIITMVFLFAGLSLAWNILGGFAGQFSLGHAGLFGIGAYVSTILYTEYTISPWLGMIIGGSAAAVVGALVFYPCFRLKGIFFCLASLAFTEVLRILATHFRDLTKGAMGINIPFRFGFENMMFRGKTGYMLIALTFMLIIALATWFLKRSRLGYKLIALREDEDTTEILGVSTAKSKLWAIMISGFFTGCLGTFYAHYTLLIDPESVFSVTLSVEFALLAILGGIGTILGPIFGAIILIPVDSLVRGYLGQSQQGISFFVYGVILIFVVMFLPQGLISWASGYTKKILAKLPGGSKDKPAQPDAVAAVEEEAPPAQERVLGPPILEVKNLAKKFGGLTVLQDLNLHINQGEILGLIGPNGAGKTTLFNVLCGVHPPSAGQIIFKSKDITGLAPPHKVARMGMGRTFQIVKPLAGLSVEDNIVAGAVQSSANITEARDRAMEIIPLVGLAKYRDQVASSLTLAGRKRLELARALAANPDLLLLDEVMAGLTPTEVEEAMVLVREISSRGVTLLVIEHVMKAVMNLADRVVAIDHGVKIFDGTPNECTQDQQVIEAYLGKDHSAC